MLGIGFGILMRNAGYGVLWAGSMSVFILAGSMQYVGVGLLSGGASILAAAITTIMSMFDSDSVSYKYAQWDGTWSVDVLSTAAQELLTADEDKYFISWATGTIEPKSSGMGSFGGPSGGFGGPGGNGDSSGMSGGPSGGTDSSSYHMASFDYTYNCVAVIEWLFQQSK